MDYKRFDDDELFELLFTEEDRLPRAAVNEIVRRWERFLPRLAEVVSEYNNWTRELPEWWAVVHASYILGAVSAPQAILPLLKALRLSTMLDCDWVFEDLPSIFGRIGSAALEGLTTIARDRTSDWFTRAIAMESLAAITITVPGTADKVFPLIGGIFTDRTEEKGAREAAGNVLLDFLRPEYREELVIFAKQREQEKAGDESAPASFTADDVQREFEQNERSLWHYTADWLMFYDAEEIRHRQDRWARE
ncbi:MAG: hypothetical protein OHK006_18700 [Thermodesulfovibrionales bacterium]